MCKGWTPSIVPDGMDQNFYLVVDRLDRDAIIFRETPVDHADLETVISDLMGGQYHDPLRVLSFNPVENWSRDVSEDVARELQRRSDLSFDDLPSSVQEFVDQYLGRDRARQLALKLVV